MGAVENEPTRYLLACVGGFIRSKINGVHWGKKEREYYFALFLSPAITTHYHFFLLPSLYPYMLHWLHVDTSPLIHDPK